MEHIPRKVREVKVRGTEWNIGVARQTRTYFSSGGLVTVVIDFKKFSVHYKKGIPNKQETDKRTESQKSKNRTIKHSWFCGQTKHHHMLKVHFELGGHPETEKERSFCWKMTFINQHWMLRQSRPQISNIYKCLGKT